MRNKRVKINEYNILGVFLQAIVTVVALVLFLLFLICGKKYLIFLEIFVSIDLLIMAYNNKKIYRRNKMTVAYIVGSILMAFYVLMTILGVK